MASGGRPVLNPNFYHKLTEVTSGLNIIKTRIFAKNSPCNHFRSNRWHAFQRVCSWGKRQIFRNLIFSNELFRSENKPLIQQVESAIISIFNWDIHRRSLSLSRLLTVPTWFDKHVVVIIHLGGDRYKNTVTPREWA